MAKVTDSDMNQYVKDKVAETKQRYEKEVISKLRTQNDGLGDITNYQLISLFHQCVSIRQQNTQKHGDMLENIVAELLAEHHIPFRQQVEINNKGCITNVGGKTSKCHHVIDFVVGNITVSSHISEYIVLSCKTTCRERWTQDNWTLTHAPKLYILITLGDDYPPTKRFMENVTRKLLTLHPKKKDDRKYRLSFNELHIELMRFVEEFP